MRFACSFCKGTGRTVTLAGIDIPCRSCFGTWIKSARPNSYQGPCFVCRRRVSSYQGILVMGKSAHLDCAQRYCRKEDK